MIKFVIQRPVTVVNLNYAAQLEAFNKLDEQEKFFACHPSQQTVVYENEEISRLFPWVPLQFEEEISIDGHRYSVECIGPKTFQYFGSLEAFTQTIYIKHL